jgi:hypothetical protein
LGLDSLMSVELVVAVEERFGVRLPVMELSEASSIGKITVRILELLRGNQDCDVQSDSGNSLQSLASDTFSRHGIDLSRDDIAQLSDGLGAQASKPSRLID